MHDDKHPELVGDAKFYVAQMLGSCIFFSGLAEAATVDDGDFECYFFNILCMLLSSDDPASHIFSYECDMDAFNTYDEAVANIRKDGILEEGTFQVVFESVARLVIGMEDSDEDEKLSLVYELAREAGYSIPDTIDIVYKLRHEYDEVPEVQVDKPDKMDMILPNSNGFLEKFRMLYAVEAENEINNLKALEKATEKISRFVLGNADDVFHAIRASEGL